MKTKKAVRVLSILIVGVLIPLCCFSSQPTGKITIRAIDEERNIVANAKVTVGWKKPALNPMGGYDVKSDTGPVSKEGFFVSSDSGYHDLFFSAEAEGMYRAYGRYSFSDVNALRRWEPWNPEETLVLRKISNPIAMYAKRYLDMKCPAASVDYDLIKGDFLPPYGQGETADCHFELKESFKKKNSVGEDIYSQQLIMTFQGDFNGLTPIPDSAMFHSEFTYPRYAYEGDYTLQKLGIRKETREPAERNFFFRIRSEKNDDGTFKSALYGKMRSPESSRIWFDDRKNITTYTISDFFFYVNPTRNDRNMEFDAAHDNNLSYPRKKSWQGEGYWRTSGYKNGEQRVTAP